MNTLSIAAGKRVAVTWSDTVVRLATLTNGTWIQSLPGGARSVVGVDAQGELFLVLPGAISRFDGTSWVAASARVPDPFVPSTLSVADDGVVHLISPGSYVEEVVTIPAGPSELIATSTPMPAPIASRFSGTLLPQILQGGAEVLTRRNGQWSATTLPLTTANDQLVAVSSSADQRPVYLTSTGEVLVGPHCTPQCAGRGCGSDGCGGTCGTCSTGFCDVGGYCSPFEVTDLGPGSSTPLVELRPAPNGDEWLFWQFYPASTQPLHFAKWANRAVTRLPDFPTLDLATSYEKAFFDGRSIATDDAGTPLVAVLTRSFVGELWHSDGFGWSKLPVPDLNPSGHALDWPMIIAQGEGVLSTVLVPSGTKRVEQRSLSAGGWSAPLVLESGPILPDACAPLSGPRGAALACSILGGVTVYRASTSDWYFDWTRLGGISNAETLAHPNPELSLGEPPAARLAAWVQAIDAGADYLPGEGNLHLTEGPHALPTVAAFVDGGFSVLERNTRGQWVEQARLNVGPLPNDFAFGFDGRGRPHLLWASDLRLHHATVPLPTDTKPDAGTCAPALVISQIYAGGGNSASTWRNDFVELHNRAATPVNVASFALQLASNTGTTWTVVSLPSVDLAPGQFGLIQLGTGGATDAGVLPVPLASSSFNLGIGGAKVALTANKVALTGDCPKGQGIVDLVGYGSATCAEGVAAPAIVDNRTALTRKPTSGGSTACLDSDTNIADFALTPAAPRNASSPVERCTAVCQ